jgi:hypothetical protein
MKWHLLLWALLFVPNILFGSIPHKLHSVLATGTWNKIVVQQTGIHKITYEDFVSMGVEMNNLDPAKIRVFGNGGGMLAETNNSPRIDDLRENCIQVFDGGDGRFDPGDFVIFYGESPDNWTFDKQKGRFTHTKNLFSDSCYYFVNTDLALGKRIQTLPSNDSSANYYSYRYSDYVFHEIDSVNLIKTGRVWVGEHFNDIKNNYSFSFYFPNLDSLSSARLVTHVVARCSDVSSFFLTDGNFFNDSIQLNATNLSSTNAFATDARKASLILKPKLPLVINLSYPLLTENSIGWLDYLEINFQRNLIWSGPQMAFRDANSIGKRFTEFRMKNSNPTVRIWDITEKENLQDIVPVMTDTSLRFRSATDSLREFVAFDGSYYNPVRVGEHIANQDLHAMDPATLIIVTHPLFIDEANMLASFHRIKDNLTVNVVKTTEIFNEFSSGQPDPTAIRDFIKLLYDKASVDTKPKYLLLFGDGTYDPKNRIPGNDNMIPTFQSENFLNTTASFVTDDYYGIMDDTSGFAAKGKIQIGVGRLPVSSIEDARIIVDKIIRYSSANDTVLSDWRNTITFLADDEDNNIHLKQAEELAGIVRTKYPVYNIHKIYNDAYKMIQTPVGPRLPDVNNAINKIVEKGTVLINYTGHGGEDGLSGEKVLTIQDINSWRNYYKLPLFITATCEFSRFDNPERLTAGEMVLLHPEGGGIALFTTTRSAFSYYNIKLNRTIINNLVADTGLPNPRLGDLIKISKNENNNDTYMKNFILLGDPALSMATPQYQITTTSINQQAVTDIPDTLVGMSKVTVGGFVHNGSGNPMETFNGICSTKIFDKFFTYTTLGNTSTSQPAPFQMQNSLLFQGKSKVVNGKFEFSCIMPKSIALQFGPGKISYYAENGYIDAAGYFDKIIIGGKDPDAVTQNIGPEIDLFMDNLNFHSGDFTGKNPVLLAFLKDNNGINSVDLGIGHEIMAILDNDLKHPINLNDYYVPEINNYAKGSIQYPFSDLAPGEHLLQVKAWNFFNISSEKEIRFIVVDPKQNVLRNVMNFPNPCTDGTTFSFEPSVDSGPLNVRIMIFSVMGDIVRILNYQVDERIGSRVNLFWDLKDEQNRKLSQGIYLYKLIVTGEDGMFWQVSQKLSIRN